jgi:hypothetical protein
MLFGLTDFGPFLVSSIPDPAAAVLPREKDD